MFTWCGLAVLVWDCGGLCVIWRAVSRLWIDMVIALVRLYMYMWFVVVLVCLISAVLMCGYGGVACCIVFCLLFVLVAGCFGYN